MAGIANWRQVLAPELVRQIEHEMSGKFMEGWNAHRRALREWMKDTSAPGDQDGASSRSQPDALPSHTRQYPAKRAPKRYWHNLILAQVHRTGSIPTKHLRSLVAADSPEYELGRSSYANALSTLEEEGAVRISDDVVYAAADESRTEDQDASDEEVSGTYGFQLDAA